MNQNRINEIYSQLEEISFSIPNFETPDEISTAIHECRKRINEVESLAVEVNRENAKVRRSILSLKKARQISYNQLMSSDERVRKGKSGLDRQAIADALLTDKDQELSDLEAIALELRFLSEAIDLRISNLNKTNSDIRLSWNIMQNTHFISSSEQFKEMPVTELSSEELASLDLSTTPKGQKQQIFDEEDFSSLLESEVKEEPKEEPKPK